MSNKSKGLAIHSLQVTLQRSRNLELILRFRKENADAKKIEAKNRELSKIIDNLVAGAMQNWLANAKGTEEKIKNSNAKLKRAITKIRKKKGKAGDLIKALGLVDDVISIATKILPI